MAESACDSNSQGDPEEPPEKGKMKAGRTSKMKVAGILSTSMWVVSFALLFVLKPDNPWVWTSDTLLLAGFWPLLFAWRPGWTWLIFGVLNMVIGFLLEVAHHLPAEHFPPAALPLREHVLAMHPMMVWLIIGFLSAVFGLFRIARTIIVWTIKLAKKKESA